MTKDKSLPTYFLKGATSRSVTSAEEWLGENHQATEFLRRGIAVHHGGLPEAVRKSVETDFRNRQFQILIATNTLAQGVNLPIRTVIIIVAGVTARKMSDLKEFQQGITGISPVGLDGRVKKLKEQSFILSKNRMTNETMNIICETGKK